MKTLILAALLCALLALDTAQGQCGDKPACPSGWTDYKDRCFFYVPKVTSWPAAQKNCQSLGANLASVRDKDEYAAIQNVILSASKDSKKAWIGGSDAQQKGSWFWADGTPFIYTNWSPGHRDNKDGNQNCIQMNFGVRIQVELLMSSKHVFTRLQFTNQSIHPSIHPSIHKDIVDSGLHR
ncbi:ladderlectin-like isoform X2 [Mastacembelus armatus]|uniref:Ladderlectin-like n=1 Tax=Mastacembelus armatus TaxID=205130 RepID=A0A3Q3LV18_9TELE|nr:ladderlectin-like isoform X2 [Mastacembelus armatus]